jgi:hypothetical protein
MSQALPTATPEQILEFKKGAAARYKEQGISPADATRLFDAHMSKLANDLGLTSKPLSPKAQKIAAAMKTIIKSTKKVPAAKPVKKS